MAIFMNIYETVLVDGMIREGEKRMLQEFEQHFEISREKLRAVRELLKLKNDTNLFTDETHPQNEPDFNFDLIYVGSGDDMTWTGRPGET